MKTLAFTMQLNAGQEQEYRRRHDEIWPELAAELKRAGVSDYSIFLDEGSGTLFGVLKLSSVNTFDSLPARPVMQKWWSYMADIMQTHADNHPVSRDLLQVFHMD